MDERGLGKVLQRARQDAGLTQQQLCSKANLSFSTLTKIERGAIKSPSIFTIQSIAGALGLSLDELVGSSGNPNKTFQKTKNGVSFIYFDVNGCLVHFYQRAFDKLSLDTGSHLETVESAFWHFNDQVCRGEMSLNDFNQALSKRLGKGSIKWQEYYLSTIEPIDSMQELLMWSSERYKVGLMTNTMPGFLSSMRRDHNLPNVSYSAIIDSSEVGHIKPEEEIYEAAEEKAGCPGGEILLIDDDRVNLMAAEKKGWHVLWFDDSRPEISVDKIKQAIEPA
ncbi:MAG TPA: HAD-IA family hydrolase [Candidatus Sulfotelmatobacter sp.]|nr:HAD-IA family hydrolase [Candidatus Sulfotelmatobacter sp.]